jgi:hypothetical protein
MTSRRPAFTVATLALITNPLATVQGQESDQAKENRTERATRAFEFLGQTAVAPSPAAFQSIPFA